MKNFRVFALVVSALITFLSGCSSGPSPEQQAREAEQEREDQRQQADFRKGLPPVANPGQGY
jgi:uncharacterized lipoprotein